MTEFGLGATVGKVVGSLGPGVLTRMSRHARADRCAAQDGSRRAGCRRAALGVRLTGAAPSCVQLVGDMIFSTSFDVMAAFLPDFDALDISADLAPLIGIETLVMNGAGDLVTPPSHSEEIVRRIPGAEHVVVEDAGHILMLEHPQLVTQQLLMLIARAPAGRGRGRAGRAASRGCAAPCRTSPRSAGWPAARAGRNGREAAS